MAKAQRYMLPANHKGHAQRLMLQGCRITVAVDNSDPLAPNIDVMVRDRRRRLVAQTIVALPEDVPENENAYAKLIFERIDSALATIKP